MDTDPNPEVSSLLEALDDSPVVEATDEVGEVEAQDEGQDTSADEQHQDEASEDENPAPLVVEFDGKKWELPPGTPPDVADGVKKMADELKADYTQKRQRDAEEAKQVKETAKTLQELAHIAAVTQQKAVELSIVQRQIAQIEAVDWNALAESDPHQAIKLQAQYQQLQRSMQQGQAELQQLSAAERQKLQADKDRRRSELLKAAPELIPGFNAKVNQELLEAVSHCGFAAEEVADLADPRMLKLINLARIGLQVQQSAPKALKKVAEAPKVMKPQAPAPKRENQSAADRLKKTGRATELINFL